MARTSVSTTLQRIRRQANSGYRYEANYLATAIDADDTQLSLTLPRSTGLQAGAIVYLDIEAMLVTAVSGQEITVVRGYYDSVPASHSLNAEVLVNPRFSPLDMFDALLDELASYGPQLYRVDSDEFAIGEAAQMVQLTDTWADAYAVLDVRRTMASDETLWPRVQFRFQRGTSEWSANSGGGPTLRLLDTVEAGTLYVVVARPFAVAGLTTADDLVTDVGLPESMLDVVAMGTKIRLWADNELGRGARTRQDEPRRAEETPVGAYVDPMQLALRVYNVRKQEEINKLRAIWPLVMR